MDIYELFVNQQEYKKSVNFGSGGSSNYSTDGKELLVWGWKL